MSEPGVWERTAEGMNRASSHADSNIPGWSQAAFELLVEYLKLHPTSTFISPQLRRWASERGFPEPPTAWAWGSVFNKASRHQLIKRVGYVQYGDSTMHLQSVSQWVPDINRVKYWEFLR